MYVTLESLINDIRQQNEQFRTVVHLLKNEYLICSVFICVFKYIFFLAHDRMSRYECLRLAVGILHDVPEFV